MHRTTKERIEERSEKTKKCEYLSLVNNMNLDINN